MVGLNIATRSAVAVACVLSAVVALGLGLQTLMDVYLIGFPDSHVTDYGKAVGTPFTLLGWAEVSLGLIFLVLAFWPMRIRPRGVGWLAALIALVVVALAVQVAVPWYYGTHLGLDNGFGG
jgi:hypothetical protein